MCITFDPPKSKGSLTVIFFLSKCPIIVFNCSKEAPWCPDYNAKKQKLFWLPILEKIDLTVKVFQKIRPFSLFFLIFFFKTVNLYNVLKYYMKCIDPLKSNAKETGPVWCKILEKNLEKRWKGLFLDPYNGCISSKMVHQNEVFFLRCNQCLKMLLLSY